MDLGQISAATATAGAGFGEAVVFDVCVPHDPPPAELGLNGPLPRSLDSYMSFPVTPFKHMIYAGTWCGGPKAHTNRGPRRSW